MKPWYSKWFWALLPLTIGLLFALMANGSQDNPTKEELLQTVAHIQKLAEQTASDLNDEKQAHVQTSQQLASAQSELATAKTNFDQYQQATKKIVDEGNAAIAAKKHLEQKLHLAKFLACGIWLAVCALVALRIPGIGMYVGGGLAVAGISAIWIWL